MSTQYPEHEKLQAKRQESLTISEFLDFLQEQQLHIGKYHTHTDECTVVERKMCCVSRTHSVKGQPDNLRYHTDECFYDSVSHSCGLSESELYCFNVPSNEQIIGLFLGIDPKKLSKEKDAMYQELRKAAAQMV